MEESDMHGYVRSMEQVAWRDPLQTRSLYILSPESFDTVQVHELDEDGRSVREYQHIRSDRVGHCWAAGRLKPGDIILVDELAGDFFYNCYLIDYTNYDNCPGVHMRLVPYKFGAYHMHATKLEGFTIQDYELLLGGQEVEVMVKLNKAA